MNNERPRHYRSTLNLYGGLIDMLLTLPLSLRHMSAVEVGSYIGESANVLSLFFLDVTCIDPLGDRETRDLFTRNTAGRNISVIMKPSELAHADLEDGRYALAYIDAVHTYEAVKVDIANYYPKVVMNEWLSGYIGGHDYGTGEENRGVVQAVNEAFGEPDFVFADESWLVKKTPGRMKV